MTKNKYFLYLLLSLPLFLLGACTPQQDDYFEVPSSSRLAGLMASTRKVLMDSEHGWLFEVFPGKEGQPFGGFVYTTKFDSLTVSVRSEVGNGPTDEVTSYYKMTNEAGAAIIFDTGNRLLHYLSEGTSKLYQAFGGDIEFVIDSVATDVVKVHGARSGNVCYFRKLTMPAKDYVAAVASVQDDFIYGNYSGTVGEKVVGIEFDLNSKQIFINPDTTQTVEELSTSFIYTDKGIRFYEPITINGSKLSDLSFDYTAGTLTGKDAAGNTIVFNGVLPEGFRKFADYEDGTYTLAYGTNAAHPSTRQVTLKKNSDMTISMTGLFDNSPDTEVKLIYSKSDGVLCLNSQAVGEEGGKTVWLCSWAYGGTLTWSKNAGLNTVWNGSETAPVYTWKNNGKTSYALDSFIMWTLNAEGKSAGAYKGTTYRVNNSTRIAKLISLTKN